MLRSVARIFLGAFLSYAGLGHLFWARQEFQAQVPTWLPFDADLVVVASGFVEIGLGLALVFTRRYRTHVGWVAAAFFVAVFPGNVSQYVNGIDAFGLDTDRARFVRLWFQPVLVAWALWSTGAWRAWRTRGRGGAARPNVLADTPGSRVVAHFPYRFDDRWKPLFALLGVQRTDGVTLTDTHLVATYGRHRVETPLSNIASATIDGPHRWYTAVGLRLSGTDDGVTFGTNHHRGVTIAFREKVAKVAVRKGHSSLWVSVADPDGLARALSGNAPLLGAEAEPS